MGVCIKLVPVKWASTVINNHYFTVKNNRTTWGIRVYLGLLLKKTQIRTSIVYKIFRTNTEQIPTLVVVFGILTDDVLVMLP